MKLVVYPTFEEFQKIVSPQDQAGARLEDRGNQAIVAKFPVSRNYLDPSIDLLKEELAQYDSGKVKTEGVWVSKQAFVKDKAIKLAQPLESGHRPRQAAQQPRS